MKVRPLLLGKTNAKTFFAGFSIKQVNLCLLIFDSIPGIYVFRKFYTKTSVCIICTFLETNSIREESFFIINRRFIQNDYNLK